jgi:hypothetical protein
MNLGANALSGTAVAQSLALWAGIRGIDLKASLLFFFFFFF